MRVLSNFLLSDAERRQTSDPSQETETLLVPGKASEPLRVAIKLGDLKLCQRIVKGGVDLDAKYGNEDRYTALMYSFEEGQRQLRSICFPRELLLRVKFAFRSIL